MVGAGAWLRYFTLPSFEKMAPVIIQEAIAEDIVHLQRGDGARAGANHHNIVLVHLQFLSMFKQIGDGRDGIFRRHVDGILQRIGVENTEVFGPFQTQTVVDGSHLEAFVHQLLEISLFKLAVAMTADKAAAEDIHHTDGAVMHLGRRIEIHIKFQGVALGILIGLHILREGTSGCNQ